MTRAVEIEHHHGRSERERRPFGFAAISLTDEIKSSSERANPATRLSLSRACFAYLLDSLTLLHSNHVHTTLTRAYFCSITAYLKDNDRTESSPFNECRRWNNFRDFAFFELFGNRQHTSMNSEVGLYSNRHIWHTRDLLRCDIIVTTFIFRGVPTDDIIAVVFSRYTKISAYHIDYITYGLLTYKSICTCVLRVSHL